MTLSHYHLSDSGAITAALKDLGFPARAAAKIAHNYPGGRGLESATPTQIASAAGYGWNNPRAMVWARRVSAAFALARVTACQAKDGPGQLRTPNDVVSKIRRMIGAEEAESFLVLLLDARQRVIDAVIVHRGSLAQVEVHPREVFRPAVQCGAHSIILAHNHPSGDPEPSDADVDLTARLVATGKTMGIPVLDHLVVTRSAHCSLAAAGLI